MGRILCYMHRNQRRQGISWVLQISIRCEKRDRSSRSLGRRRERVVLASVAAAGVFATTTTMKLPRELAVLLLLPLSSLALPTLDAGQIPLLPLTSSFGKIHTNVRPLVLWHGLGELISPLE